VRKISYALGALWSLLIWATAEGFGHSDNVPTDMGTAIIYAVVFLALLALDVRAGTRALSVDAVIERTFMAFNSATGTWTPPFILNEIC
jgi:nitrite reductase (NO-forming)